MQDYKKIFFAAKPQIPMVNSYDFFKQSNFAGAAEKGILFPILFCPIFRQHIGLKGIDLLFFKQEEQV